MSKHSSDRWTKSKEWDLEFESFILTMQLSSRLTEPNPSKICLTIKLAKGTSIMKTFKNANRIFRKFIVRKELKNKKFSFTVWQLSESLFSILSSLVSGLSTESNRNKREKSSNWWKIWKLKLKKLTSDPDFNIDFCFMHISIFHTFLLTHILIIIYS